MLPIISSKDLRRIEEAMRKGKVEGTLSFDLGKTQTTVVLKKEGFMYEGKEIKLEKLREDDKSCYIIEEGKLVKLQFLAHDTKLLYKLIPTSGPPLLQCSGTSMHKKEFVQRIEKEKLTGKILDAGTGLGYTAIAAAQTAEYVLTIEHDSHIITIAKFNPYSQELFERKNIELIEGDMAEEVEKRETGEFDYLILDGGTPRASGDFFSLKNYQECCRILKTEGKVFHYLPNPQIKQGRDFGMEVIDRMEKIGFKLIERDKEGSYAILQKE